LVSKGDIVSIDVSLFYNGFHGDTCGTFYVGDLNADPEAKELMEVAKNATLKGAEVCAPGR